jgi:hypothetical protein
MAGFFRMTGTIFLALVIMSALTTYGLVAGLGVALFGCIFLYIGMSMRRYDASALLIVITLVVSYLLVLTANPLGTLVAFSSCAGAIIGWFNMY